MKPSGIQVNKPVVGFIAVGVIVGIWYVKFSGSAGEVVHSVESVQDALPPSDSVPQALVNPSQSEEGNAPSNNNNVAEKDNTLQNPDMANNEAQTGDGSIEGISQSVIDSFKVTPVKVKVNSSGKEVEIFTRQVVPSVAVKQDIILLHGARFSSANWENIKTLQLFGALGYRLVAVDLPRYGESRDVAAPSDMVEFMVNLIKSLGMTTPVMISPSMSGGFSLPLLVKAQENLKGYVALAPVIPRDITDEQLKQVKIPVLIIYGDRDLGLGVTSKERLSNVQNHTVYVLPGGHPVYLEKPKEFHQYLLEFLLSLAT